jgi:hypothetical protein
MPNLSQICKSINTQKDPDLIDEYNKTEYIPYIINRIYSLHADTLLLANEINKYPFLDKDIQYKYYVYGVRKKSRFAPWLKYKISDELQAIKTYYGYSTKQAKRVISLLSKETIEELKRFNNNGGIQDNISKN